MIDIELAYFFGLGMLAAVNPCGFAMLPAYLSYFIGLEGAATDARSGVLRALAVGGAVTAGFIAVFSLIGLVITHLGITVYDRLPWVTIAVGIGLAVLGVAMVRGFQLTVPLPKAQMGTSGREVWSMFLFGVSYAVVSLSCTLPVILPVVVGTFRRANLASGVAAFVVYAIGMGLVIVAITVALAVARGGLVRHIRKIQPYISRVSGALLIVAGAYVAYYGYWQMRVNTDLTDLPPSGVLDLVTRAQETVSGWITTIGFERLGVALVALIAVAVILAVGLGRPAPKADSRH